MKPLCWVCQASLSRIWQKTNVNTYLVKRGFQFFIADEAEVPSLAKRYLGKRFDVADKLAALENPVDVIEKVTKTLAKP